MMPTASPPTETAPAILELATVVLTIGASAVLVRIGKRQVDQVAAV